MKQKSAKYPLLSLYFTAFGMFIGGLRIGFNHWQAYFLGLPFFLIGCAISGLITGNVIYKSGEYGPMKSANRKEQPGTFWFAIFISLLIAWWLISEFYRFSSAF
ncbi:MAG: hypothetical protein ACPGUD_07875 [Parashewanella sp.]